MADEPEDFDLDDDDDDDDDEEGPEIGVTVDVLFFGTIERSIRRRYGLVDAAAS